MNCFNCDYYRENHMLNYCFCVKTKEHPCYYINDDYTFKEDIPFFGFKKGTDSKEVFKWQNI